MPSALGGIGPGLFQGGASNSRASIEHGLDRFSQIVQNQVAIEENRRRQKDQQKFQDEQRKKQEKAARRAFWTGKAVDLGTGLVTGAIAGGLVPAAGDVAGEAAQATGDAARTSAETAAKTAAATPGTTAAQTALATAPPVDPSFADSINTMGAGGGTIPTPPMAPINSAAPPRVPAGASIPQPPSYSATLPSRGRNILTGAAIGALGSQPGGQFAAGVLADSSRAFNPVGFARQDYLNAQTANEIAKTPLELARIAEQINTTRLLGGSHEADTRWTDARARKVAAETKTIEELLRPKVETETQRGRSFASLADSRAEDATTARARRPGQVVGDWSDAFQKGAAGIKNINQAGSASARTANIAQDTKFDEEMHRPRLSKAQSDAEIAAGMAARIPPPSMNETDFLRSVKSLLDDSGRIVPGNEEAFMGVLNSQPHLKTNGAFMNGLMNHVGIDPYADAKKKRELAEQKSAKDQLGIVNTILQKDEGYGPIPLSLVEVMKKIGITPEMFEYYLAKRGKNQNLK